MWSKYGWKTDDHCFVAYSSGSSSRVSFFFSPPPPEFGLNVKGLEATKWVMSTKYIRAGLPNTLTTVNCLGWLTRYVGALIFNPWTARFCATGLIPRFMFRFVKLADAFILFVFIAVDATPKSNLKGWINKLRGIWPPKTTSRERFNGQHQPCRLIINYFDHFENPSNWSHQSNSDINHTVQQTFVIKLQSPWKRPSGRSSSPCAVALLALKRHKWAS